jgi:hypothetical protein
MLNRIKGFAYDIVLYFVLFTIKNKNKSKKVLIIRVDEIGDYILFLGTSEANSPQTVITQISIVRSPEPILEIVLSKQVSIQSNTRIEFYSPYNIPGLVHPTNYCLNGV